VQVEKKQFEKQMKKRRKKKKISFCNLLQIHKRNKKNIYQKLKLTKKKKQSPSWSLLRFPSMLLAGQLVQQVYKNETV